MSKVTKLPTARVEASEFLEEIKKEDLESFILIGVRKEGGTMHAICHMSPHECVSLMEHVKYHIINGAQ